MSLDEIIDGIYPLPETSKARLKAISEEKSYDKGEIIIRMDTIEQNAFLIKKGIVRAYSYTNDNEVTFWFGKEGDTVISMKSYVENKRGYENIELLEDCILFRIRFRELLKLYEEDIHIANWGRKFAEKELIRAEERLISRAFKTATERYLELLENQGKLLQRVQLGHIASYLGITQVSLSRIRSEIR